MNVAIVTGASSGMGKEFVLQLSQYVKVDEIWVIARREDALKALQAQVSRNSLLPKTSSPLVPRSRNRLQTSSFHRGVARSPAVISPPT